MGDLNIMYDENSATERELLFRGKRIDNGEWEYGKFVTFKSLMKRREYYIIPVFSESLCGISVDPRTIGQYTGLDDMNTERIFEGDIIQCSVDSKLYKVEYVSENWFGFCFIKYGTDECMHLYELDECDIKVVGTIYDNLDTYINLI